MKNIKIVVSAVLLAAAGGVFAQADTTREQRIDQALQDYRAKNPSATSGMTTPPARGMRSDRPMAGDRKGEYASPSGPRPTMDKSFGQNMKAAGSNLKEGGKEVGHDVAQGARKGTAAVKRGAHSVAEKARDVTTDKPAPKVN